MPRSSLLLLLTIVGLVAAAYGLRFDDGEWK